MNNDKRMSEEERAELKADLARVTPVYEKAYAEYKKVLKKWDMWDD